VGEPPERIGNSEKLAKQERKDADKKAKKKAVSSNETAFVYQ